MVTTSYESNNKASNVIEKLSSVVDKMKMISYETDAHTMFKLNVTFSSVIDVTLLNNNPSSLNNDTDGTNNKAIADITKTTPLYMFSSASINTSPSAITMKVTPYKLDLAVIGI